MSARVDVDDIILNFDTPAPHRRLRGAGFEAALTPPAALRQSVPEPAGAPMKYGGLTAAASLIDTSAVIDAGPQARARR